MPASGDGAAGVFGVFGPNKRREIDRLAFEIARREQTTLADVLARIPSTAVTFAAVRAWLVARRFPELTAAGVAVEGPFPAVNIDPGAACDLTVPRVFSPSRIVVERGAESYPLLGRVRTLYPGARVEIRDNIRHGEPGGVSPRAYNRRCGDLYLVRDRHPVVKPCPCTPGVHGCGYYHVNLGTGCPFECTYCFLQSYTNVPGIILPVNIDEILEVLRDLPRGVRVGSGEMTDSLALDHISGFAPRIVEAFRDLPERAFEFKTKSDRIEGLLSVSASSNVVVAWSLNPPGVVAGEEFFTAPLAARLEAAARSARAGYRVAFHLDPVVLSPGWENAYAALVENLFRSVPAAAVAWVSLGMLRMTAGQKKMIENRFPGTTILLSEMTTAPDGKIRYHETVRERGYRHLLDCVRGAAPRTPVYLCMEPFSLWRRLGVNPEQRMF